MIQDAIKSFYAFKVINDEILVIFIATNFISFLLNKLYNPKNNNNSI